MPYFVYILRNPEGRFYIGQSSNLALRLERHNGGDVTWTKSRGPWELAYSEEYATRQEAMAREKALKGLKSKAALRRLIAQR